MSGTLMTLHFSFIVDDPARWDEANKIAGDDDPDWVVAQINEVMIKAGDDFIKAHPDLFRGSEVI